jgi:hypothetical protein
VVRRPQGHCRRRAEVPWYSCFLVESLVLSVKPRLCCRLRVARMARGSACAASSALALRDYDLSPFQVGGGTEPGRQATRPCARRAHGRPRVRPCLENERLGVVRLTSADWCATGVRASRC